MAPIMVSEDRLTSGHRLSHPPPGDEVVITGVSGYFPESDSVFHLQENLFNKVDLITVDERRWSLSNPEIPQRAGKINNLHKFDASFFDIHNKEAHTMDPMSRILLEKAYEAIFDSGMNPNELRNSKTGVFIGAAFSESGQTWVRSSRALLANRISYWLGVTGTSYIVDSACSSSLYALEHAFRAIRDGHCDAAIVGGSNLCLHPYNTMHFSRAGVLSPDGICKCFDESANGYVRAEAISAVFLQRLKNSRRAYAQILYAKTSCDGFKEEGIMYPSVNVQKLFLKEFYEECAISPRNLEFFEAHGTGTRAGDLMELCSIDGTFTPGRADPLKIGTVKSNMGHSEQASGLCAIVKMCIAYSTGYIPPNLHYEYPRKDVSALTEHRLKVVTDKTPWQRGMSGVNGFGFGGSNAHVLLKNIAKDKVNKGLPFDDLPRLVCVSGRTESAVAKILNELESRTVDVELMCLLHTIHNTNIPGHVVRGYALLGSTLSKSVSLARDVQYFSGVYRPVWFVYSGMGSQSAGMAADLMKIPGFAAAIQKCHKILESKGINLTEIITGANPKIFDNAINSFIGITAVQIGLTDVLKNIGIKPDHTIGHDIIGELACTYAGGSLTAEETIILSYNRGSNYLRSLVYEDSIPTEEIECNQSAVPFEETFSQIHQNAIIIEIAPSGILQTSLKSFLKNSLNIPIIEKNNKDNVLMFFSAIGQLYEAGLNPHLANIYPHVPFPVSQGTPMLAHLVEWEHSDDWFVPLFKKQLNEKLGERTVKISLADHSWEYLSGHNIGGRNLYPGAGYLVLVWEAFGLMMGRIYTEVSVVFENVCFLRATNIPKNDTLEFVITIHRESGHFEILESGATVVTGKIYAEENVCKNFYELPTSPEITGSDIKLPSLNTKDFYKEFRLRGYRQSGSFQNILEWDIRNTHGRTYWINNWVTFLDSLLQIKIISVDTRDLTVPTRLDKLSIDVNLHYNNYTSKMNPTSTNNYLEVKMYHDCDVIRSGGVEVRCLHVTPMNKKALPGVPVLERNEFFANFGHVQMKVEEILRIYIHLIVENIQYYKVKTIELADVEYKKNGYNSLLGKVEDILGDVPLIRAEMLLVSDNCKTVSQGATVVKNLHGQSKIVVFIGANLLVRPEVLQQAASTLSDKCFLISREKTRPNLQQYSDEYDIVSIYYTGVEYFVLFRKRVGARPTKYIKIVTSDASYSWIDKVKNYLKDSKKLVLYSQDEPINGLLGLVQCLRKEPGGEIVYGLLIDDPSALAFDPDLDFYKEQLDKDLAINVYKDGQWGTYRHLLLGDLETVRANHAYVNSLSIGNLSSLRWLEGHLTENYEFKNPQEVLIHVYCAALNFRDVMTATGRLSISDMARGRLAQECAQGIEIAGKTKDGAHVMGLVSNCGLANLAVGFKPVLLPIPDNWSFEEAASVPVAYSTAYYAMVMVGQMQRGESILIHAGSGGVGQAAINVALHYGCEIFTTVGTAEKRAFIKKLFPLLKDSHIGNSRDTSFEDMIRRETNGKGVDLVLNSLSDDKLQASIRCLGSLGRFLEIGKFDISNNTSIGMHYFSKEISFHSIMLDYMIETCDYKEIQRLQNLILAGIESGAVSPLTYCTFEMNEVEAAYRYMAAGKHIGKVIIKIRDEDRNRLSISPTHMPVEAMPRYTCHEDHVYILVGGLGGFGLELADWLILRGARKVMLTSRRGVVNGYQSSRLRVWASYGADVQISTEDVVSETGCEAMLKAANAMGPVEAIFNLAVILKDAVFQNQTPESFETSYGPKAMATVHLDKLSKNMCPKLKDFVVFSSVTCARGTAGQTNYGFSNSAMEKICELRKKLGFPALAIQWGAIGDVGVLSNASSEEFRGTLQQKISSCLLVLDRFMKQDNAIVSSLVVAEKSAGSGRGSIVETIAQIMGIKDLNTVSQQVSFAELGMDSMTAVEIKQTLEREFEVFLTSQDIRTMTFPKLVELSTKKETPSDNAFVKEKSMTVPLKKFTNLKDFIRNFGDETEASKPFIYIPTMVTGFFEGEEAIHVMERVMFVLPGLEGCAAVLEPLCRRLKIKVCVLQLGVEHRHEDLDAMVSRLHQIVASILVPDSQYWLLGYSFGSLLALELGARLELQGLKGIVFCLDGSPDFLNATLTTLISKNDFDLQNSLLSNIIDNIATNNVPIDPLMEKLNEIESYDERVKVAYGALPTPLKEKYSNNFIAGIASVCYDRVKIILHYNPKNFKKLKSAIFLLRQKENPANVVIDESYGLDKFTENTVIVHYLEANYVDIIENNDMANIINKVLVESGKGINKI